MGLLILFGQIGERVSLAIARAKAPNLLAKEPGTPVLVSPYPTKKASCQVISGGLEKIPHILGILFLEILLLFSLYLTHTKPSFYHFIIIFSRAARDKPIT
jgi:hypothetical protein